MSYFERFTVSANHWAELELTCEECGWTYDPPDQAVGYNSTTLGALTDCANAHREDCS